MILRLDVLVEHGFVEDGQTNRRTDEQTDGQTQGHSIYRACIASRGKNTISNYTLLAVFILKHVYRPIENILKRKHATIIKKYIINIIAMGLYNTTI